jgi:L-iditol 2-dehydrogenase
MHDNSGTALAAVWRGEHRLSVESWPLPEMGPEDALVRVRRCGVCGSDVHIVDGDITEFTPPRVLGHEPLGVVEAVGDAVAAFRPGDHVTWEPSLPCRSCFYCHEGEDGLCEQRIPIPGGFAERTVVPQRALYHVPAGLADGLGVLAEPLSCALYAHDRGRLRVGDRVAVIGAGTIGLLLTMLARRAGASLVVVSDPNARKREIAAAVGADMTVDPGAASATERIRHLTGGRGADVAFEAVGSPATVQDTLAVLRPGGRAVLVGLTSPTASATVPLFDSLRRDITIEAVWLRRFTFQRAVALLTELPLGHLISHSVPLGRIEHAFDLLRSGEGVKVVVEP